MKPAEPRPERSGIVELWVNGKLKKQTYYQTPKERKDWMDLNGKVCEMNNSKFEFIIKPH